MTKTPNFLIEVDDQDITEKIKHRLIELTITDKSGLEADEMELVISDHDGKVAMPRRGVKVRCFIGWKGEPLVDKGTYTVDEVEHSGPPDKLTIRGRSADFRNGLKTLKERSWHKTTLGKILETIASEQHLEGKLSESLRNIPIQHIDQTNESDANLLTRLAETHNAVLTVKNGCLLMLKRGESKSVSGFDLEPVVITRQDGDTHRYTEADRGGRYTGVKAYWYDKKKGKKEFVIIGSKGYLKTLRQIFCSEEEAHSALSGVFNQLRREKHSLNIQPTSIHLNLLIEEAVILDGWQTDIVNLPWYISEVVFQLYQSGLTVIIKMKA
ncbi:late control protein [Veronia nyctiphanis]|uniref:Late control protein n=1 Tax=Veronia nyctiphanis TaxID=1278244 RepID=A0A4Q0YKX8_9GAMM|nr:contractile injection system protein, VgrG/Pvc8 family [Veronia nyctiphanis]RXJ70664.1 late control protein [Veronia nyctiphanis]